MARFLSATLEFCDKTFSETHRTAPCEPDTRGSVSLLQILAGSETKEIGELHEYLFAVVEVIVRAGRQRIRWIARPAGETVA